ncbi:MAG: TIGR01212 family radical SAM protein [Clostridia bacterium]
MFKYTLDNKRYHTLSYHNKSQNIKNQKAIINIGCTCPNVDGVKAVGGCIYCDGSSSYFSQDKLLSVTKQLELELQRINKKWGNIGVTAYFQSGSNTYISTKKLQEYINEVLKNENIVGISIATRPDCLSKLMLDYLEKLNKITNLTVELGLQTIHDKTANLINRAYPFEVFEKSFNILQEKNIRCCVHLINGLPGETFNDMITTAKLLGKMKPQGLKIHLLHVLTGTKLADMYLKGEYTPLTFEEYIEIVVAQLEQLPAEIVIERITGDAPKDKLLSPVWSKDKIKVLGNIDKKMLEKDTWQGKLAIF